MPLSIAELKARLAQTKLGNRGGNFIRLEPDVPIIVHVLPGNDSLWFRQIASHWLGKRRVSCSNPTQDEDGECFICSQIRQQREVLAEAKREHEHDTGEAAKENNELFKSTEDALAKIAPRRAFAFNVLVRGKNGVVEEVPKTIEAPWALFQGVYNYFNSAIMDYEVDITDPKASTPFTLSRTGSGKTGTRYSATAAPRSVAIFSGPGAAEKIASILEKALDLDEQYKFPSRDELVAAWNAYTNGQGEEDTKPELAPAPKPPTPPSLSRIGASSRPGPRPNAVTPLPAKKFVPKHLQPDPEEPDEIPGLEANHSEQEEEVPAIPSKAEANAASLKLLSRLKKGNK